MQMFKDYKSPLGYEVGEDGIDSYGVNHNGFSTRDELEYQMARQNREQQLIQNYNSQGITENYPQYGTNFWGDNAYDNYGFGNSDISGNVQNVTNKLNGTDYSVLPDYSIGSANSYNNTGGYNNYANYSATDYTVNTENLMGKPSSYFQNNNTYGSATGRAIENTAGVITAPNTTSSPIMEPINRYLASVLPQYTAPTSLGQVSEVDYYFNRDKEELCEDEGGFVPYAYLDTSKNHYATIGCGINIDKTPDIRLYIAQTGQPLSAEQLKVEMEKLKASQKNNKHTYYEDKSDIRIAPEENERIMKNKYVDGYNTVTDLYPDYDRYSEDRQKALMNMVYNLGNAGFTKYTHLRDAILHNDWKRAAGEAWRCGIGFERNAKTVNRLYPGLDVDEMRLRHCKNDKKK